MADTVTKKATERVRKPLRLHPDLAQKVVYWALKHELFENEYMVEAIEEKIARENGDYELPTLEQHRLNQILDEMVSMRTSLVNLEATTTSGFDSLLGLTRGDSYLLDEENGELGVTDNASAAAGG